MCNPFVDPTKVIIIYKGFVWILVVIHCVATTVILLVNITLVRNLKRSQKHMRKSNLENLKTNLVIQLFIMTTSNFLCWIPADVIFILTMFFPKYPLNLIKWPIVSILPINSIVYPVVFSTVCIRKTMKSKSKKNKDRRLKILPHIP